MTDEIEIRVGIPEALRQEAAELYDEAFGAKFSVAVPDREKRLRLLADSLSLSFSVAALARGRLVGLAGFQTPQGSLTRGMTAGKLFRHLGIFGGSRAALVFSLYERKPQESVLLMDGIAVSKEMRGKGIGTGLLEELKRYAREQGFARIRLDVIDTNEAARRLYERRGFVPTHTEEFGYLRGFLGFGASTTLMYTVG
ncbi:MAG: GNAT family N-acetyltransferase [Holophagales bacterium]|nr:GNAT family N-acetyltransferase [Holophagales bacterium]